MALRVNGSEIPMSYVGSGQRRGKTFKPEVALYRPCDQASCPDLNAGLRARGACNGHLPVTTTGQQKRRPRAAFCFIVTLAEIRWLPCDAQYRPVQAGRSLAAKLRREPEPATSKNPPKCR